MIDGKIKRSLIVLACAVWIVFFPYVIGLIFPIAEPTSSVFEVWGVGVILLIIIGLSVALIVKGVVTIYNYIKDGD